MHDTHSSPTRTVVIEAKVFADTEQEAKEYAEAYGEFIFSGDEVVSVSFRVEPEGTEAPIVWSAA